MNLNICGDFQICIGVPLVISYSNILVKVSTVTFRGIKHISLQSKVVSIKNSKYICDVGLDLPQ